jgi:hypothetical protein
MVPVNGQSFSGNPNIIQELCSFFKSLVCYAGLKKSQLYPYGYLL